MNLAIHRQQSQFYLVAVSSALAFGAWNYADPGRLCSQHYVWPVLTVVIFVAWLFVCAIRRSNTNSWNWKQFAIAAFFGGGMFAMLSILWGVGETILQGPYEEEPIRGVLQPLTSA